MWREVCQATPQGGVRLRAFPSPGGAVRQPVTFAHRNLVFAELARGIGSAICAARRVDNRVASPGDEVLLAAVGGIGELVMREILERGVGSLPELEPPIVELLQRVSYPPPGN